MRKMLSECLIRLYSEERFIFLTGDLGFMAFEELRSVMQEDFINAGVAEQNMVSMAAGMASEGLVCFAYSIAPFLYARPFEQIRNDVCFHGLPVKLIGNGGGFGYGVMGSTHHALEDYGALLTLAGMKAYVPSFREDIDAILRISLRESGPAYIRLGMDEKPQDYSVSQFSEWRKLEAGNGSLIVAVGPLAGTLVKLLREESSSPASPEIWALSGLPVSYEQFPKAFLSSLGADRKLFVIEEHVRHGSAGSLLSLELLKHGHHPRHFEHLCPESTLFNRSGSQKYYREKSGIGREILLRALCEGS